MKRLGNVYDKICSLENLRRAHYKCRRGKAHYRDVKWVNANMTDALMSVREMLLRGDYKVSDYITTHINDRGKDRTLMKLPYYPDRIVQWAVMLQAGNMFNRCYNSISCAAIRGRGIHYAKKMLQRYLSNDELGTKYCLKLDVKKFYDNIDHGILKSKLNGKIKDVRLLWLLGVIIDSVDGGKGIPLGSLLSQNFANFYLTSLDNYLKHGKKVKHVIRYMDDIVVLGGAKEYLREVFGHIKEHLDALKLRVKENWQIFPVDVRGIDFVGYRVFRNYVLLRKSICRRFKSRAIRLRQRLAGGLPGSSRDRRSVSAYNGWLKHCNSYRLKKKYLDGLLSTKGAA